MLWNWQQSDWPQFAWSPHLLAKAEERFLMNGGVILGTARHFDDAGRRHLMVKALSDDAVTSSEIEGEVLNSESVQSSIRRELGLESPMSRRATPAEQGISEMMIDLYRTANGPLEDSTLFAWHEMLMRGRRDLREVGAYRTHREPMQVVSGKMYDPKVHFEAPPSANVPAEMAAFVAWFNRTGPDDEEPLPAITRAGVAHLYFESIHPFEDGNGRIGRAISQKALAQAFRGSLFIALAPTILARRRGYYDSLEANNKGNEINPWLVWFAGVTLESQQRSQREIEFVIEKTRLLDRVRDNVNERQIKVLLRMFAEGPAGFTGGLSASNYMSIAKTSPATAGRDLADLVEKGALTRTGERRYARYWPAIAMPPMPRITVSDSGEIVEE